MGFSQESLDEEKVFIFRGAAADRLNLPHHTLRNEIFEEIFTHFTTSIFTHFKTSIIILFKTRVFSFPSLIKFHLSPIRFHR